jgi:SAM-dependent methyltransferase
VTVYAAANISVPPLVPFLGFASVQAGERLLHGRWMHVGLDVFRRDALAMAGRFFVDWLVGGLPVGAAIGLAMAAVVYPLARAHRRHAVDPVRAAIREASRRFRAVERSLRMYAWFKYRLDPCYRAIASLIADGTFTVDLGTGMGMLPIVMALLPGKRRVLGVDWDARKIAAGRVAASGLVGVELAEGDVRTYVIPECDAITIVDVLHYYEPAAQRVLLARCAEVLGPGGRLLIREGDGGRGRGALWTRGIEEAAVRLQWNRGDGRTRFRALEDLKREVESVGFSVGVAAVSGKLHPGNFLLIAVKEAGTATPGAKK